MNYILNFLVILLVMTNCVVIGLQLMMMFNGKVRKVESYEEYDPIIPKGDEDE